MLILSQGFHAAVPEPAKEPEITSIYPIGAQLGRTYAAEIRGRDLKLARSIWFREAGLRARVLKVESIAGSNDILHAEVTVEESAPVGRRPLRVVTGNGVSNEIEVHVFPAGPGQLMDGKIEKRGAVNSYPIDVESGQTLCFEVTSGFRGFDPSIEIKKIDLQKTFTNQYAQRAKERFKS